MEDVIGNHHKIYFDVSYQFVLGMKRVLKNKGVSIVESIIYISILALFTAVVMSALVGFSQSYRKLRTARIIATSATIALDRMVREFRIAESVDLVWSVLESDAGRVRLLTTDDDGYAHTVAFALEEGRLVLYEDDVLIGPLTSEHASTTKARFTRVSTPHSQALRVEVSITAGANEYLRTEDFIVAGQLRNSL